MIPAWLAGPALKLVGWLVAALVALTVGWTAHAYVLKSRIDSHAKARAEAVAAETLAKGNLKALRDAQAASTAKAQAALRAARSETAKVRSTVDELRALILAGGETECKPAVSVIREALRK